MMASNASHTTITKIATPAANAPGAGIMCGIVSVWPFEREFPVKTRRFLRFQTRCDADFRLEEFRYRAARFGSLHRRVEFGFVRPGNFRNEVQMALRDGEAIPDFFERYGCGRLKPAGRHSRSAQLGGKRHRKSTGVRGCEELLGICAHTVFKARAVGVLRLLQDAAVCRNRALPIFQSALPNRRCLALHAFSPFGSFVLYDSREFDSQPACKGIFRK